MRRNRRSPHHLLRLDADLIDKFADSELATVWKALIKKCSAGDVQAMRLYFDVRERSAGGRASEDSGWFK